MMVDELQALWTKIYAWILTEVLQWAVAVELVIAVGVLVAGGIIGRSVQRRIEARYANLLDGKSAPHLSQVLTACARAVWLLAAAVLFEICLVIAKLSGQIYHPFKIGLNLCVAIAFIRMTSSLIKNRLIARFIEVVALSAAVLSILGVLKPVAEYLQSYSFSIGDAEMSVYSIIKGLVLIVLLLEAAKFLARLIERRISGSKQLTPSLQVLWIKAANIVLVLLAFIIGLQSVGFSLTSVTIFSGAVGVGIGFGLQKIFSNFISGVILLLENSIKPGDTIEVSNIYGQIRSMNARFVSMASRDGKEYLIPNEKFIVNDVVNWTYSTSEVRVRIPVGIPYHADLEECLKILEESVQGIPRVLENPAPRAVAKGFGNDAIELELRIWIKDPESGLGRVRSAAVVAVWRAFRNHGISIPYPQRDLHLISVSDDAADGLSRAVEKEQAVGD